MITRDIEKAANSLRSGDLIGLPTETVYGLAANAFDESAVLKIFELKQRPLHNPLILHTNSLHRIREFVTSIPPLAIEVANKFWPGPLTILLPKSSKVSDVVTAGSALVAVRIPNHPMALALLEQLEFPLAAPSANPYQRISPTTALQVYEYFGESIDCILDGGPCDCGLESTILGFENNRIVVYRLGAITIEILQENFGEISFKTSERTGIRTSGMDKCHYAPRTKLVVVKDCQTYKEQHPHMNIGVLDFKKSNMTDIARSYYQQLYEMDKKGYDLIVTEYFINQDMGRVLNDKLDRAASVL